jgi:hypothetical protein
MSWFEPVAEALSDWERGASKFQGSHFDALIFLVLKHFEMAAFCSCQVIQIHSIEPDMSVYCIIL